MSANVFAADPLATADQAEAERLALRLFEHAPVRAAREAARARLRDDPAAQTKDGRLGLERALDQWTLALCMREANGDPAYPKVTWNVDNAPRAWFGHIYPGAAVAVDNPDNINREIPIDGGGRYELDITLSLRPASQSVMLEVEPEHHAGLGRNLGTIPAPDLHPDAEGRIRVTIDADPAGGRAHHLRTEPGRLVVYVRDSMADWAMVPARLTVRRLDPPPTPPRSFDQVAALVVAAMQPWVNFWCGFKDSFLGYPAPNQLIGPQGRIGGWGFLAGGRYHLPEGSALLVTVAETGAGYTGFQITDPWTIAPDPAHRCPSLNKTQALPSADGTISYVVCPTDPGVANWIDTTGLTEGWMLMRWQGVPPGADPAGSIREVRLIDAGAVPAGLPRIDLAGRAAAMAERARLREARTAAGRVAG
jgi:hypothetical protein